MDEHSKAPRIEDILTYGTRVNWLSGPIGFSIDGMDALEEIVKITGLPLNLVLDDVVKVARMMYRDAWAPEVPDGCCCQWARVSGITGVLRSNTDGGCLLHNEE